MGKALYQGTFATISHGVKDVDFGRNEIVIHDGKGAKDRVTMLPEKLKPELQRHLERVGAVHERDLPRVWGGWCCRTRWGESSKMQIGNGAGSLCFRRVRYRRNL